MPDVFSSDEARVIACLIEKSVNTPDLYPMTLNSLTNACNQKSGRNPVMSLDKGTVQRTIRVLETKHLVRADENFKSRTEKYSQRFCNTRYSHYQFDPAQLSIICVLLLRGPQTPGELRSHSGRLHSFEDNAEVVQALTDSKCFTWCWLQVNLTGWFFLDVAKSLHLGGFSGIRFDAVATARLRYASSETQRRSAEPRAGFHESDLS